MIPVAMFAAAAALAEEGTDDLRQWCDASIREHRMGRLVVLTEPRAEVRVEQQRHAFEFGAALSSQFFDGSFENRPEVLARALEIVGENFTAAVPENAMKWDHMEIVRGQQRWEVFDRMLAFCEHNDIKVRGHCVLWAGERAVPRWARELDDDALREAIDDRIRGTLQRYRGRVEEFDLNNEMIYQTYFKDRLGEDIRVHMFKLAHEVAPETPMYLNEFGVLVQHALDRYEGLVTRLLEAGAPVGGIGIQGHPRRGIPSAAPIKSALDRMAAFGLPLKITEFAIGRDSRQQGGEELERLYRVAFAHPAVEGIYTWSFWEAAHWRPQAALWREDFGLTPAGEAYRRLVFDEWWTETTATADEDGRVEIPAFFGTHTVTAAGSIRSVALLPDQSPLEVDLR